MLRAICGILLAAHALTMTTTAARQQVYRPGDGVSLPVVVTRVNPHYTDEAQAQRIEGTVTLDAVVLADGTVGEVGVVQSLDSVFGLDRQAVDAMKQWTFKPGLKEGKPVAVRVQVKMSFSLK